MGIHYSINITIDIEGEIDTDDEYLAIRCDECEAVYNSEVCKSCPACGSRDHKCPKCNSTNTEDLLTGFYLCYDCGKEFPE